MLKAWLAVANASWQWALQKPNSRARGWHSTMVRVLAERFPSGELSNWAVYQTLLPHTWAGTASRRRGLHSLLTVAGISSVSPAAKIVPGA